MNAIALALVAQALAISIQTYAIFDEIPESERILTILVLIIATIQIVSTRPRPQPGYGVEPPSPAAELGAPAAEPRSVGANPGSRASMTAREQRGNLEPNRATPSANQPTEHPASHRDALDASRTNAYTSRMRRWWTMMRSAACSHARCERPQEVTEMRFRSAVAERRAELRMFPSIPGSRIRAAEAGRRRSVLHPLANRTGSDLPDHGRGRPASAAPVQRLDE